MSPRGPYFYPVLLGALVGFGYAFILRLIDGAWPASNLAHRALDWTFPVLFGVALGVAVGDVPPASCAPPTSVQPLAASAIATAFIGNLAALRRRCGTSCSPAPTPCCR